MVNEYTWEIFNRLYGGGPAIPKLGKDIYAPDADPKAIPKIRFAEDDNEVLEEMKAIMKDEDIYEEEKAGEQQT